MVREKGLTLSIFLDLVKFVTFYILTKGYTVPGNQGTHDKLNQIPFLNRKSLILKKIGVLRSCDPIDLIINCICLLFH